MGGSGGDMHVLCAWEGRAGWIRVAKLGQSQGMPARTPNAEPAAAGPLCYATLCACTARPATPCHPITTDHRPVSR